MARVQEQSGNYEAASAQYKRALEVDPKHLEATLGMAHLRDRQDRLAEATEFYAKAARQHPNSSMAQNDLGLCYARQRMLDKSVTALNRAVQLDPGRKLYRNNFATVLIETRQYDAALKHLVKAHGEAPGHYNLGYLLHQRGDDAKAAEHFAVASRLDPSLTAARVWLEKLRWQTQPLARRDLPVRPQATIESTSATQPPATPQVMIRRMTPRAPGERSPFAAGAMRDRYGQLNTPAAAPETASSMRMAPPQQSVAPPMKLPAIAPTDLGTSKSEPTPNLPFAVPRSVQPLPTQPPTPAPQVKPTETAPVELQPVQLQTPGLTPPSGGQPGVAPEPTSSVQSVGGVQQASWEAPHLLQPPLGPNNRFAPPAANPPEPDERDQADDRQAGPPSVPRIAGDFTVADRY